MLEIPSFYTDKVNSHAAEKYQTEKSFEKAEEEDVTVPKPQQRCQANARERYRTHRYYRLDM